MAELMSSSDDDSLGEEEHEAIKRPTASPWTPRVVPPREAKSPARARAARNDTEPEEEEELMESMFSPLKRTPAKRRRSDHGDGSLFPFTPSPTCTEELPLPNSLEEDETTTHKPVISATAMLTKYLPKTTDAAAKPQAPHSSQKDQKTAFSPKRALELVSGDPDDASTWTKRPKKNQTKDDEEPVLSASERIARKYGLLPSSASSAAPAAESNTRIAPARCESRRQNSTKPSPQYHEQEQDENQRVGRRSSLETTKESFWKQQVGEKPRAEESTPHGVATTYKSPFATAQQRGGGFRDMRHRRQQQPVVDKETFYTDDAKQPLLVNRPRHVIASKLTEASGGGEGEDDGWLSDAQEIASEDEDDLLDHQRKPKLKLQAVPSSADLRSSYSTAAAGKRGHPKAAKPSMDDSDSDLDQEGHVDLHQWPLLPPPKNGAADTGPLQLVSPTAEYADVQVCANMNRYLFDYQREGAQFLFNAYVNRTGAILGDEMGLGKTIQVIAFLSAVLNKQGDHRDEDAWREVRKARRRRSAGGQDNDITTDTHKNPILIVVPASLLHNWESELRIWMCCCTVILHGKPQEREQIIEQAGKGDYEIVICSYDVVKITLDKLKRVPWELIIFDEMHCLKNPDSQLTQAVKAIRCPRKLGLTGTLMQNNEKELHCLIDTIAPGVLGSWSEFRAYYGHDIKYGRKKSAVPEAVERSRQKEKKLRQVLVPYYLRREKEINPCFQEVKKCDQVVFCDLTPYQLAAYKRILAMPEFELLRMGEELCDCGRDSKRKRKECCYTTPADLGMTGQRALLWERFHPSGEACKSCPNCMGLVCVAQLLKLSNHMELLKVNPHDPPKLQGYQADFAATALGEDLEAVGGVRQVATFQEMRAIGTQTCGKMLVLEKLLALWKRKRQKTLLFSRSTRMLDILQLFLISKAVSYLRLDGQTKVDERLQLVNKFNDPESTISVFLISTRAGGLGLNLPTATNVVIFDPSWNPAHDCQAQDRAYRIGQTKDVQVYRLITLGTIEEMIYVRQIYKQQLSDTTLKGVKAPRYFEGVQGDRKQQGELFGIRNLLCWKEGGVLKDIQDAYKRDRDDLVIQETLVEYDTTKQQQSTPGSASKKKRSRQSLKQRGDASEMAHVDEEMVEVADEMMADMLSPSPSTGTGEEMAGADEGKPLALEEEEEKQQQQDSESESDGSDGEMEACFLQGARTLMHDNIVGQDDEESGDQGADPFSETDEEDEEDAHEEKEGGDVHDQTTADTVTIPAPLPVQEDVVVQPPVVATETHEPSPAPPQVEQSGASDAVIVVDAAMPPPRKSLYIPQYL